MSSDVVGRPTIADLTGDNHYAQLARKTWLAKSTPRMTADVVQTELFDRLKAEGFSYASLLLLEQLQVLERYLWPGFSEEASDSHVVLLALLVNIKRREHLPDWSVFEKKKEEFSIFFRRVLHLSVNLSLGTTLRTQLLTFIDGAFQSLDSGIVRKECAPLVSIGIWHNLHSEACKETQLMKTTQLQKAWKAAAKRYDSADADGQARLRFDRSWLYTLVLQSLDKLYEEDGSPDEKQLNVLFAQALLELLCDLQSQLPTRRYVNTLLQDIHVLSVIRLSPLYQDEQNGLLRDMLELLEHYINFPIDDQSGKQLSKQEYEDIHNNRVSNLQKTALAVYPEKLKLLVLANYGSASQRDELEGHFKLLTDAELTELARALGIRTAYPEKSLIVQDRQLFTEIMLATFEAKQYYTARLNEISTMPTENLIYQPSLLRTENYTGSHPLSLPKLNLQYLTLGDFLHRSFTLYRSEAFYEVRKHMEDTVKRMQPRLDTRNGITRFDGFSRMAIPIPKPGIVEVLPSRVGEDVPSEVKAEVIIDVSQLQPGLRREWESLRQDDLVYLLAVHPEDKSRKLTNGHSEDHQTSSESVGIKALRCAEVISILDENSRVLRHNQDTQDHIDGLGRPRQRRLLLRLDASSYKDDKERADAGKADLYGNINVVVRRKARENNFKPVLDGIKRLALSDMPLPKWLEEVFLGYGDPSSASYQRLSTKLTTLDFRDTFLDWHHLVESLPGKVVEPDSAENSSFPPPYVLSTPNTEKPLPPLPTKKGKKRRHDQPDGPEPATTIPETVRVSSYRPENNGPYPTDAPSLNTIRYTPSQIEAITSGTQPGLTMIVGPPGTGKTDVTTQIISNIYHNFPHQRTLLIAHSNQALNQLFQKITKLDIDERHLLRLGHGEEDLETDTNFTKAGRVESFLERGSYYLGEVQRLAMSINAVGAHGSSCETADYFNQVYITPIWKRFWDHVAIEEDAQQIVADFPFIAFFANAPQPLFPPDSTRDQIVEIAKGCERHIDQIFEELADIRPFEILRNNRDKSNYLLVKEARIVAMTSTHAAIRRQEIATLGFKYDNVVMEEAAQITEIENFIPLVLQQPALSKDGKATNELKRIVLVGDHLQNSPVVQNAAYRSYANLEQSLFLRLMRLGVPHTLLDAQGRARPSIAALFKWRYPKLTNLPFTATAPEFVQANAGFKYDYQFIDVPDYNRKGETEPSPHFLQNLGEAEYAVALYQYMRLLGYPAEKISILTAYAGQRALIRDVLSHRCKGNRLFGMPGWVGTVDKYQGEQNDYVILSLVRTRSPGYLRDLRRLTVALSRARLGLYVLGRREVFESTLELREAFSLLFQRPNTLSLVTGEMHPTSRTVDEDVQSTEMEGIEHLGQYVYEMTQAKIKALKEGATQLPPAATSRGRVEEDGEGASDEEDDAVGLAANGGTEEDEGMNV